MDFLCIEATTGQSLWCISCCSEIRFGQNQTKVDGGGCPFYGTLSYFCSSSGVTRVFTLTPEEPRQVGNPANKILLHSTYSYAHSACFPKWHSGGWRFRHELAEVFWTSNAWKSIFLYDAQDGTADYIVLPMLQPLHTPLKGKDPYCYHNVHSPITQAKLMNQTRLSLGTCYINFTIPVAILKMQGREKEIDQEITLGAKWKIMSYIRRRMGTIHVRVSGDQQIYLAQLKPSGRPIVMTFNTFLHVRPFN